MELVEIAICLQNKIEKIHLHCFFVLLKQFLKTIIICYLNAFKAVQFFSPPPPTFVFEGELGTLEKKCNNYN